MLESRHAPIGLVVPMVVIDELEKQKRSSNKNLRRHAQVTLAIVERVARHGGAGRLREADFSPIDEGGITSGEIWLDVLFDLPGHVRLAINDDEIVDRALSVQILSGKDVTFLTDDTNQALRARHADLTNAMHLRSTNMCCKTPRGVGLLWELPETGLWGQHSTVFRVQWSDTRGTSGTKTPPGEINPVLSLTRSGGRRRTPRPTAPTGTVRQTVVLA